MKEPEYSTGLGWADPSPSKYGYDWDAIAATLKTEPGKWFKVFEDGPTSIVNTIRQGSVWQLRREDGFEVTTRNNKLPGDGRPTKTCDLYLRYVKRGR